MTDAWETQSQKRKPRSLFWLFLPTAWHTEQPPTSPGTPMGRVRWQSLASALAQGLGSCSPLSLGKWMFWSSSKALVSAKRKDQRYRSNKGFLGCRVSSRSHLSCPLPLHIPGLTFFTGGLIGGVRAVGSVITLQEAVDAAAIATAELGGMTSARAYCMGTVPGRGRSGWSRSEQAPSLSPTWSSQPPHSIMACPLIPFHNSHALPEHSYMPTGQILKGGCWAAKGGVHVALPQPMR